MIDLRMTRRISINAVRPGFNLMEVLIAIGVFAVGLVSIAAIFPTAISQQRETVYGITAQQVAVSARASFMAMVQSGYLCYEHNINEDNRIGTLAAYAASDDDKINSIITRETVLPLLDSQVGVMDKNYNSFYVFAPPKFNDSPDYADPPFDEVFTLDVRSYPSNIEDPSRRDYYWFPFVRLLSADTTNPKWFGYIMILRRTGNGAPPDIRRINAEEGNNSEGTGRINFLKTQDVYTDSYSGNDLNKNGIPDLISPGDLVLASNGLIHQVIMADIDGINVKSAYVGQIHWLYFAIGTDQDGNTVKREIRSPIVYIDEFEFAPLTPPAVQ